MVYKGNKKADIKQNDNNIFKMTKLIRKTVKYYWWYKNENRNLCFTNAAWKDDRLKKKQKQA